jgi:hypothetical protein
MNEEELLEAQLKKLVAETCKHPQGSDAREDGLKMVIRIIEASDKLWRDSSPYYEDALQKTRLYFCRTLSAYGPTKASLITWFNNHLKLTNLVVEACQHPQSSVERQRVLNELVPRIQQSGKIWRNSSPDYEDALQQMWLYFCDKPSAYDPTKASLITWFNRNLKWRLFDLHTKKDKKPKEKDKKPSTKKDKKPKEKVIFVEPVRPDGTNIIEEIPAPDSYLDSEEDLWDFVCTWIEKDTDGKFKGTHVRDRPDVNAQVVCLGRLHGKLWRDLATELRSSIPVLSGFYRTQCIRLLKEIPVIKQAYESREAE